MLRPETPFAAPEAVPKLTLPKVTLSHSVDLSCGLAVRATRGQKKPALHGWSGA
jgi:hypothetical protein